MAPADSLEAPQANTFPRRMRQSDLDALAENDNWMPLPLRPSKVGRRESRLGLRNIFARSGRTAKEDDGPSSPKASRPTGLRASLAEMSYWPQARSEITLPTTTEVSETPSEQPEPDQHSSHGPSSEENWKPAMAASRQLRMPLATWTMPPLFKAYPQATRHGTLPAVTLSADAILRLNEKKKLASADPIAAMNEIIEKSQGDERERPRRRNRSDSLASRNLQWTTKIYILITSGYLLQYADDGHFDRLPEKVLRLGKSSAAFATDAIPGRHWVLQVSSAADGDVASSTDSRSLFSKLSFRIPDRRHTSNLFMVCESAADMEDWITSLRSVIEKLGGKKNLSETRAPRMDEGEVHLLRPRPSQRTLVVKDPDRFSRVISSGSSWLQEEEPRASDCSTAVTEYDAAAQDQSLDDVSTTNSIVSHDGRQLDNLRDNSNRLSVLSSGQRTVVTSTTSSPASSPIIDRFLRPGEGLPALRDGRATPEARPRPNAGIILNRQMSLQAIGPFVGEDSTGGAAEPRPASSSCGPTGRGDGTLSPPNFSVPKSSSRRFSYIKASSAEQENSDSATLMPRTSLRKLATIRTGRPLSTVVDQPSPRESIPERPVTSHYAQARPSTPPVDVPKLPQGRLMSVHHDVPSRDEAPGRRLSLMPRVLSAKSGSQLGLPSLKALRKQDDMASTMRGDAGLARPPTAHQLLPPPVAPWAENVRRRRSSLDPSETSRSFTVGWSRAAKRASICSNFSDRSATGVVEPLPKRAPPPAGPLPPIPPRPSTANKPMKTAMGTRVLASKRSMPQLAAEGPPPAPPPTCALPPIPKKLAAKA